MDNGVSPAKRPWRRWGFRRRPRGIVPPAEGRTYIHPSELPGEFEQLLSSTPAPTSRRAISSLLAGAALLLAVASFVLYANGSTEPTTDALPAHLAKTISAIPRVGQRVANTTLQVTSEVGGHLISGGAMIVGSGDVAVTTLHLAPNAPITGSSVDHARMNVQWMAYDRHLGLTYLQLPHMFPLTPVAPHHEVEPVLVISPYFSTSSVTPEFAYATTQLSDPRRTTGDGIVSYLTSTAPAALHGLTGSVAIGRAGDVVAMLASNGQWITADYVAKVATAWLAAPNCHGRLGISGVPSEGGGVRVTAVPAGPSFGKLRSGDIVTTLNEQPVDTMDQIVTDLYATPGRTAMVVQFLRDRQPSFVVVHLGCLS